MPERELNTLHAALDRKNIFPPHHLARKLLSHEKEVLALLSIFACVFEKRKCRNFHKLLKFIQRKKEKKFSKRKSKLKFSFLKVEVSSKKLKFLLKIEVFFKLGEDKKKFSYLLNILAHLKFL